MHIFSDLSVSQSVLTISLMTHHLFNRSNDIAKLGSHTSQYGHTVLMCIFAGNSDSRFLIFSFSNILKL